MARLPALSRRSFMDGVPHRISRWRPAPVARREGLGVMLTRHAHPQRTRKGRLAWQQARRRRTTSMSRMWNISDTGTNRCWRASSSRAAAGRSRSWSSCTAEPGSGATEALARKGVMVAALDFRVPPAAPYPASLADIHCGIRWCKTQAPAWNGRPDRIGAMGTSSGAHQAMLLGMRPGDPRYAALSLPAGATTVDGTLGCVIMVSPVIDPLGRYQDAKGLRQDCTPPA